jgi:cell division protein FtsW (lipid II flippase)
MLQKLWRKLSIAANWPVLAAVAVLSAAGIIAIYAQKPALGLKQLEYLCIAIGCMAVVQGVNWCFIRRRGRIFIICPASKNKTGRMRGSISGSLRWSRAN